MSKTEGNNEPLTPELLHKMDAYCAPRIICRWAKSIFTTIRC